MSEITASGPTWGTWKDHGHAAELVYLGTNRKSPDTSTGTLVTVTMATGMLTMKATDGSLVNRAGAASRFWARIVTDADRKRNAPEVPEECIECHVPEGAEHEEWCSSTDVEENEVAAKPAKTPKPAKAEKTAKPALEPVSCKCGCGEVTGKGSLFRQGHDARMVSNLVTLVTKGETSRDEAIKAAAKISEPLKAKTVRALDNAAAKVARAAVAQEAKAAADRAKAEAK
jgi:hypothetical protein